MAGRTRRGRPATNPRPAEPRPVTATGLDIENYEWAPDGGRIALVLVGVFISITLELCGIHSLSFAVGSYLPIATTAPIFASTTKSTPM